MGSVSIRPNNSGTVDGITDHHYGDGTKTIIVTLDANGIATCDNVINDQRCSIVHRSVMAGGVADRKAGAGGEAEGRV